MTELRRRFRILVTGSRNYTAEDIIRAALANVIAARGPENVTVIHGACPRGADAIADRIAIGWTGVTVERYPAVWDACSLGCPPDHRIKKRVGDTDHPGELDTYCPKAGPRRNALMVGLGADICLAFPIPGGRGTANCMKLATVAGIPVEEYRA